MANGSDLVAGSCGDIERSAVSLAGLGSDTAHFEHQCARMGRKLVKTVVLGHWQ